jgi:hypothetical protein
MLMTKIGTAVQTDMHTVQTGQGDFGKNATLNSPLHSSCRDECSVWTSDERVMTSGRLDPHPNRSDRLNWEVRSVFVV